jgi:hypothetical protein
MSKKTLGRAGILVGATVLLVSLAANLIGVGSNPREFGWLQTLGSIIGFVVLAIGLWVRQQVE